MFYNEKLVLYLAIEFTLQTLMLNECLYNKGMFGYDVLKLKLDMTRFDESVFLGPLQSSNLIISLNPGMNEIHQLKTISIFC